MPSHPRRSRAAPLLALCFGLAACGDDDAPPGDGGAIDARTPPRPDTGTPPTPDTGAPPGPDGATPGANDCDSPHPSWLMCEDFEDGDGDFATWFAASPFLTALGEDDRGRLDLSPDAPHAGRYAIHMGASAASGYLGADLGWVSCEGEHRVNCTPRNHERLYLRAFVRFADDHRYVHHFLNVGGRDRFWSYGAAGCLPNGTSQMGTTVDHRRDSHETFFYTYHLDMSCDTRCDRYADVARNCAECADRGFPTCDTQPQCCWGNHFEPDPPVAFPVGRWFCFEMMMEPNTPGARDGIMAYYLDDVEIHRESTLAWRTTTDLGMNYARLQHYIDVGDDDHSNRVSFDDVVVSTERIGCASF